MKTSRKILDETRKFWGSTTIPDRYLKRADAYLKKNDWSRASTEFSRSVNGFPEYSDNFERWRELGVENSPRRHLYLDLKTFDGRNSNSMKLWIKQTQSAGEDGAFIVQWYELKCGLQ
jgi:hypothetical protein